MRHRLEQFSNLAIAVPFFLCAYDAAEQQEPIIPTPVAAFDPWEAEADLLAVDIVQRTCALEVVLRPIVLRVPDDLVRLAHEGMDLPAVEPTDPIPACT